MIFCEILENCNRIATASPLNWWRLFVIKPGLYIDCYLPKLYCSAFRVMLKTGTNLASVLVIFVVGGLHLFLGDIYCAQLGCVNAVHPYLFYTVQYCV